MGVAIGTRLGPYEIVALAGAGGMGEVYKANDTRLDRVVAIKVLPERIAGDDDLRQRFIREARAISSLNHPNICTLHDIGHQNGIDYLVMEFLEGETLASRLSRGAIPPVELLTIAQQMADALEKAHRQGLIHRDLKPGNIMLTKSGAKLMDFGLAKFQQTGAAVADGSGATRTTPLTGQGTILGTLQYMSPELLEGREADTRSDIFCLGTILYEMATGRRAFEGTSPASLIAAILKESPRPITELQDMLPPMLDRVVRQCLEKDPDHRWQSAGDLKRGLSWVAEGGSQIGVPVLVSKRRTARERLLWGTIAVLTVVSAVLIFKHFTRTAPTPRVARWTIGTPRELSSISWPRISPDGSMIVFLGIDSLANRGIYVRPLNSLEALLLTKVEGENTRPFWSPDSRQIAYFERGRLWKVSISGGSAQLVCEAPSGVDGAWGGNGIILFDGVYTDSIQAVSSGGGSPMAASRIYRENGEFGNTWPCFLPDGEHFLFLANLDSVPDEYNLRLGSLRSLESTVLGRVNSRVEYADGYVLYVRNGLLMAHRFDEADLRFVGDAVPVASDVSSVFDRAQFSVSSDGTLLYQRGASALLGTIEKRLRDADSSVTVGPPSRYGDFSLSPDNQKIAVTIYDDRSATSDVWIRDLARTSTMRLTFGPGSNEWPIWTPDGKDVIFTSDRARDRWCAYSRAANGAGTDELMYARDSADVSIVDVSRDRRTWVVTTGSSNTDLWLVDVATKSIDSILARPDWESRGQLSPDGRFLAYNSSESRRSEVYIREVGPGGGKWQVSTNGGRCPKWRGDGGELYYVTGEFDYMAVPISYDGSISVGSPIRLFNHRSVPVTGITLSNYDVSDDGQTFYILTPIDSKSSSEFVVVQHWAEELKK